MCQYVSIRKSQNKIMYWVVLTCYALRVTVTANDPRPPKVQVADVLRSEIANGLYPAGSRLPSVRDLAARFGVAPGTVQAGLLLLQQESLVFSAGNRGTFVQAPDTAQDGGISLSERIDDLASQLRKLTERVASLERGDAVHG